MMDTETLHLETQKLFYILGQKAGYIQQAHLFLTWLKINWISLLQTKKKLLN